MELLKEFFDGERLIVISNFMLVAVTIWLGKVTLTAVQHEDHRHEEEMSRIEHDVDQKEAK